MTHVAEELKVTAGDVDALDERLVDAVVDDVARVVAGQMLAVLVSDAHAHEHLVPQRRRVLRRPLDRAVEEAQDAVEVLWIRPRERERRRRDRAPQRPRTVHRQQGPCLRRRVVDGEEARA